MSGKIEKFFNILLIEDNPGDVRLVMEALKESKVHNTLHPVQDGIEAIEFLRKQGKFTSAPRPDLILLDLNLPRKDGRAVLSEIKSDEDLRRIPVVILTSSMSEEDIMKSYNSYANCYINKPVDLDNFIDIIKSIVNFWLTIIRLPPK